MLRRLKHHINVKISQLLDHMIFATLALFALSLGLILVYTITDNFAWLGLLWISGMLYAVSFYSDVIKYSKIIDQLDQDSLNGSIWLSSPFWILL